MTGAEQELAPAGLSAALSPKPPLGFRARHAGERAKRLRQAGGLSRRRLAAETKIPGDWLMRFETGRTQPTPKMLRRLLGAPALDGLVEWALRLGLAIEPAPTLGKD